jgi:hypothetical protein
MITKKMLIQGVSKRLKLSDDYFSKQQRAELADLARMLLVCRHSESFKQVSHAQPAFFRTR